MMRRKVNEVKRMQQRVTRMIRLVWSELVVVGCWSWIHHDRMRLTWRQAVRFGVIIGGGAGRARVILHNLQNEAMQCSGRN